MPLIEWTPAFSVGSPVLDADHRKLISILNQIHDAWQKRAGTAELTPLFDSLQDYADTHFSREEVKLAERGYDELEKHRAQHDRLRELVSAFRSRHLAQCRPEDLTEETTKFLRSWLMDHILGDDMRYRPLFAKN